ncbi:MAG: hypothetical protein M3550_16905 [Actinomycetota bacterium]|nr:hypothetical protein [Actinomycetota bacterium]
MNFTRVLRWQNRAMVGVDLALGVGALAAPAPMLRLMGHVDPSEDAQWLFRRCGPIWLTFAAAHAAAAVRGRREDWWALAWLRTTELATEVVWSRSPAFSSPGRRAALASTGAINLGMGLGFTYMARRER